MTTTPDNIMDLSRSGLPIPLSITNDRQFSAIISVTAATAAGASS
jgi:hypothetical protein